jgi:hypothetical protein
MISTEANYNQLRPLEVIKATFSPPRMEVNREATRTRISGRGKLPEAERRRRRV